VRTRLAGRSLLALTTISSGWYVLGCPSTGLGWGRDLPGWLAARHALAGSGPARASRFACCCIRAHPAVYAALVQAASARALGPRRSSRWPPRARSLAEARGAIVSRALSAGAGAARYWLSSSMAVTTLSSVAQVL